MTKEQLAETLNGRKYGSEITLEESEQAKEAGLVVVFGYSDDNMMFEGAIQDEAGCFNGGEALVNADGLFVPDQICDSYNEYDPCKLIQREMARCKTITAIWGEGGCSWTYSTDIPHSTFSIFEGGELYCVGIVFSLSEVTA